MELGINEIKLNEELVTLEEKENKEEDIMKEKKNIKHEKFTKVKNRIFEEFNGKFVDGVMDKHAHAVALAESREILKSIYKDSKSQVSMVEEVTEAVMVKILDNSTRYNVTYFRSEGNHLGINHDSKVDEPTAIINAALQSAGVITPTPVNLEGEFKYGADPSDVEKIEKALASISRLGKWFDGELRKGAKVVYRADNQLLIVESSKWSELVEELKTKMSRSQKASLNTLVKLGKSKTSSFTVQELNEEGTLIKYCIVKNVFGEILDKKVLQEEENKEEEKDMKVEEAAETVVETVEAESVVVEEVAVVVETATVEEVAATVEEVTTQVEETVITMTSEQLQKLLDDAAQAAQQNALTMVGEKIKELEAAQKKAVDQANTQIEELKQQNKELQNQLKDAEAKAFASDVVTKKALKNALKAQEKLELERKELKELKKGAMTKFEGLTGAYDIKFRGFTAVQLFKAAEAMNSKLPTGIEWSANKAIQAVDFTADIAKKAVVATAKAANATVNATANATVAVANAVVPTEEAVGKRIQKRVEKAGTNAQTVVIGATTYVVDANNQLIALNS